jgi:hypothetical protein
LRPCTENKIIFRIRGQKKLRPNPHKLRVEGKRGFCTRLVKTNPIYRQTV